MRADNKVRSELASYEQYVLVIMSRNYVVKFILPVDLDLPFRWWFVLLLLRRCGGVAILRHSESGLSVVRAQITDVRGFAFGSSGVLSVVSK